MLIHGVFTGIRAGPILLSENSQLSNIQLTPSHVSVFATNGTVVGVLKTVTQHSDETFTYILLEESQLPFAVTGDKLVLAKKRINDFRVTSTSISFVPLSIKSIGSRSGNLIKSFYIRIDGKWAYCDAYE